MRPVEMDKIGLLAAAMYTILEDRHYRKLVISFSVLVDLIPANADDRVMFGNISGSIVTNTNTSDRCKDFKIYFTGSDLRIEVSNKTLLTPCDRTVVISDNEGPIEIDFDKRTITYKKVHTLSMKNVVWDWRSVGGTALDVIGIILGEENS